MLQVVQQLGGLLLAWITSTALPAIIIERVMQRVLDEDSTQPADDQPGRVAERLACVLLWERGRGGVKRPQ
jgi:hypothetical protein